MLTRKPLFPGKNVVHQLELITDLLGTPSAESMSRVCLLILSIFYFVSLLIEKFVIKSEVSLFSLGYAVDSE